METQFHVGNLAAALGWVAASVALVLVVTFVVGRIAHKHSVIDAAWGLLFVAAAWAAFFSTSGPLPRRLVLLILPTLWGLRLGVHIGRRMVGKGEDPRYEALLAKAKGNPTWYAIRSVYLLQGLLALVISAPIVVGMTAPGGVGPLTLVGIVLWCVGVFFETVGDAQMERFRADPAHKGKVIDVGLWRYTRHPNYFGDACVWWGIFLVAAEHWPGILTVFAPVLMTLLLTAGSGVRILEKHMAGRDGWAEYKARTSAFIPLPPKKSTPKRSAQ